MNVLDRDSEGKHDLELVLEVDGLGGHLALLCGKLGDVCLGRLLGWCRSGLVAGVGDILDGAVFKVLAKHFDFTDELVGACLDGHTGTMVSLGEESTLSLHTCPAGAEFDF